MSSKIDNVEFNSTHRRLEIPEFLVNEKDNVEATKHQNILSSENYSNLPDNESCIELNKLDYELIQAIREAGL